MYFGLFCARVQKSKSVSLSILSYFCKYKLVVSWTPCIEFFWGASLRIYQNLRNEAHKKSKKEKMDLDCIVPGAVWNFTISHSFAATFSRYRVWIFLFLAYFFYYSMHTMSICSLFNVHGHSGTTIAIHRCVSVCVAICLHSATVNLMLLKKQRLNFIFILR